MIVVVVVDVVVDVVVAVVNVVSVVNLCWWFGVGVFGGAAADGDEERERTGKQEQQKERREQKSKAGPYTLPNSRSPASGGNYHVKPIFLMMISITLHKHTVQQYNLLADRPGGQPQRQYLSNDKDNSDNNNS